MNYKLLCVAALGIGALGYYAHDAEVPIVSELVHKIWGSPQAPRAAKSKAPKPVRQKVKADGAAHAVAATPQPPAPQPEVAAAAAEPEPKPEPAQTTPAAAGSARVGDVLATLPLVKDTKPNTDARYYIYLMSAGWCGPCNMEMPNVVKAYEGIRQAGIAEIILVDFDDSVENARAYMDKYGATFPSIMKDAAAVLPGIQPPGGIPSAFIVDAMGYAVVSGHGSIIGAWQEHIAAYEEKNGLPSSFSQELPDAQVEPPAAHGDADAAEGAAGKSARKQAANLVARSASKVKWATGRPNRKAQYYIYLQSASWCGPCQAEMPTIAAEYKAMKKDGRVELLLISFDKTESAARKFLDSHKASFPMTLRNARGVSELAGFTMAQGIPDATIVDATGRVIARGHGSLVKDWRKYTIDAEPAQGK